MGEGTHLPTSANVGQTKGRWVWLFGGASVAIVTGGLLMQYVRTTVTKAASDPPAGTARVAAAAKKPESLARVGKESITFDMVAEEAVKRHGREVLDDLIHRLVIQQACEENKITVSEQEISDEIARIAKRFGLEVSQWVQMLQVERNISPVQYRQSVIYPMIALKKLAGEDVDIEEDDIKRAFIRNYGPRVKARMIMFDNQRRAQEGWDEVQNDPDNFEKIAQKLSIDQSSRALGGQIPPIARYSGSSGSDTDNVEKVAFKMKAGEISGVIEVAPNRWIILKCEGRTEPVVTDIGEVREVLFEELKETKIQAAVAKKFDEIKSRILVDNYMTGYTNRPDRASGATKSKGDVQTVSDTQAKPGSNRSANTAAGNSKSNRN